MVRLRPIRCLLLLDAELGRELRPELRPLAEAGSQLARRACDRHDAHVLDELAYVGLAYLADHHLVQAGDDFGGRPLGPTSPNEAASTMSAPSSFSVGRSGNSGTRSLAAMAMGRIWPPWMKARVGMSVAKMRFTSPDTIALKAGDPP